MGVVIPLFKTEEPHTERELTNEQRLRVKLIQNSIEALKREEKSVEQAITDKCRDEIDHLNIIDGKLRQLETELDELCHGRRRRTPTCPKR